MFEIRITLHDQDDVNESMEMLRAFVLALLETEHIDAELQ